MPDLILIPEDREIWLHQLQDAPAWAAMLGDETGYGYDGFRGFEPLGYERVAVLVPHPTGLMGLSWVPHYTDDTPNTLYTYRLRESAAR